MAGNKAATRTINAGTSPNIFDISLNENKRRILPDVLKTKSV
jgi:hypothetical protein